MEFKFLRGTRLLQMLNEVSTYPKLNTNIERGFPNTTKRQHATQPVVVTNISYVPYLRNKSLQLAGNARSNGRVYSPTIQFLNVEYQNTDLDTNVTFTATNGQEYHCSQIVLANNNVKVRCNCLDFYYRFAFYNKTDGSLFGRSPRPYIRKTNTRPPANPDKVPGVCKHVIKLLQALEHAKLIRR